MEQKQRRYKRLKWRSFLCVPANSGRIIGEVCFADRWGNEYRWAPDWDSVMLLMAEALATEVTNDPDGAWAQVFKDLAGVAVRRTASGKAHPKYPELIDELLDTVYMGACLQDQCPNGRIVKRVTLGPIEWDFLRYPKCSGAPRFVRLATLQERACGFFKCRTCGYEFVSEAGKDPH